MLAVIVEIIGAVTVVVSLLYVAVQIRHNTAVARSDAYSQIATEQMNLLENWASDPEWRALLARILYEDVGPADLTKDETLMGYLHCHTNLRLFEQTYRKVNEGILPPEILNAGRGLLRTRFARETCPSLRNEYSVEFWQWVAEALDIPENGVDARLENVTASTDPTND